METNAGTLIGLPCGEEGNKSLAYIDPREVILVLTQAQQGRKMDEDGNEILITRDRTLLIMKTRNGTEAVHTSATQDSVLAAFAEMGVTIVTPDVEESVDREEISRTKDQIEAERAMAENRRKREAEAAEVGADGS